MPISWRAQHDVYRRSRPEPDFLAFDGDQVIGRMFQIKRNSNGGRWLWSVMAGGPETADCMPVCGIAERQDEAARHVAEAYAGLARGLSSGPAPIDCDLS